MSSNKKVFTLTQRLEDCGEKKLKKITDGLEDVVWSYLKENGVDKAKFEDISFTLKTPDKPEIKITRQIRPVVQMIGERIFAENLALFQQREIDNFIKVLEDVQNKNQEFAEQIDELYSNQTC